MTDSKHIVNLITFSQPEKKRVSGFKRNKQSDHCPFRL